MKKGIINFSDNKFAGRFSTRGNRIDLVDYVGESVYVGQVHTYDELYYSPVKEVYYPLFSRVAIGDTDDRVVLKFTWDEIGEIPTPKRYAVIGDNAKANIINADDRLKHDRIPTAPDFYDFDIIDVEATGVGLVHSLGKYNWGSPGDISRRVDEMGVDSGVACELVEMLRGAEADTLIKIEDLFSINALYVAIGEHMQEYNDMHMLFPQMFRPKLIKSAFAPDKIRQPLKFVPPNFEKLQG